MKKVKSFKLDHLANTKHCALSQPKSIAAKGVFAFIQFFLNSKRKKHRTGQAFLSICNFVYWFLCHLTRKDWPLITLTCHFNPFTLPETPFSISDSENIDPNTINNFLTAKLCAVNYILSVLLTSFSQLVYQQQHLVFYL